VGGGEGLNLRSQEGNRGTKVINHGDELGEKGGHSELAVREGCGGGIVDSGERSRVKVSEPGSMPKNVGDIVGFPGERGVTGLGRRGARERISPTVLARGGRASRANSRGRACTSGSERGRRHLDKANRPGLGTGRRRREKVKSNYQFDFPKNPRSKGEIYISLEDAAQVKSQNRCIVKK